MALPKKLKMPHVAYKPIWNIILFHPNQLMFMTPKSFQTPKYSMMLFKLKVSKNIMGLVDDIWYNDEVIDLGSTLLCNIMTIKKWKKWIDFMEIKFHSNENVEWHFI